MSSNWNPLKSNTRSVLLSTLLMALAASLSACPGELQDPDSFLNYVPDCDVEKDLFPNKCGTSGCHGSDSPQADLDLVSPGVAQRVNNVAAKGGSCAGRLLANPVDPESSALYNKLTPSYCGDSRMPLGTPLSDAEQACILAWIQGLTPISSTVSSTGVGGAGGASGSGGQSSAGGQGGM